MKHDTEADQRLVSRWALPGSLAAHLLVVALLIFGLPLPFLEAEEEKPIAVDLVPPPKSQEEAKAKPPPPSPPPQEKPEEPKQPEVEKPPPGEDDAAKQAPQPMISPVFQFGEKDAGPREARDGNSPEDGSASPVTERQPEKQEEPKEPPPLTASKSESAVPLPDASEAPEPKPTDAANAAKKQEATQPKAAKKLFSQQATGDVIATAAMGRLPRGVRAGRLCVTELREQLRNSWPPYFPDLLPSFRLEEGTVIDVPKAAFRVNGEWYDLSYRCEVDTDATRVVAFAFRVGDLLPPDERRRRRLPSR